jgi:hypothetical protein
MEFSKNGKKLKFTRPTLTHKEKVMALSDFVPHEERLSFTKMCIHAIGFDNKRVFYSWAAITASTFLIINLIVLSASIGQKATNKYNIFSSKPLVLEETNYTILSDDSRAKKIDGVFRKFKCPLEGLGNTFIEAADDNDIPWYLAASVAFQESSCGKNTPKINGAETYNAWGWGVYGTRVHAFDNWAEGINTVSEYFSTNFISKGVTDTCVIMKTYTPPSDGSWCYGVNHFATIFQNYQSL